LSGKLSTCSSAVAWDINETLKRLRNNAGGPPKEESAIFYVNTEDQGKILIFTRNEVYLLETKYASVVRVTSALPKTDRQFETGELTTEPLRDVFAIVQPIAGTPKYAGGGVGLGWFICFQENGKPPSGSDCHIFAHYQGPPLGEQNPVIAAPPIPPRNWELTPIKISEKVQQSRLIHKVDPVYPEQAKSVHLSGKVILSVTVDEKGNVSDIKVTNGHPLLDEAAKAAVSQWKYSPTLLNGEPVPVITTVTVSFSITTSGETATSVGN
jgi:TonB family protein